MPDSAGRFHSTIPSQVYCGPFVLSLLTGVPGTEINRLIADRRKKLRDPRPSEPDQIVGTTWRELEETLWALGFQTYDRVFVLHGPTVKKNGEWRLAQRPPTLFRFAKEAQQDAVYLVRVTGHFVVFCHGLIYDNTSPDGVPASQHRDRRKRVSHYAKVGISLDLACALTERP